MAEITTANIQAAKDALVVYHTAHAALSVEQEMAPNHVLPDFQKRHTKLINDFKVALAAQKFDSIAQFFQSAPEVS